MKINFTFPYSLSSAPVFRIAVLLRNSWHTRHSLSLSTASGISCLEAMWFLSWYWPTAPAAPFAGKYTISFRTHLILKKRCERETERKKSSLSLYSTKLYTASGWPSVMKIQCTRLLGRWNEPTCYSIYIEVYLDFIINTILLYRLSARQRCRSCFHGAATSESNSLRCVEDVRK